MEIDPIVVFVKIMQLMLCVASRQSDMVNMSAARAWGATLKKIVV